MSADLIEAVKQNQYQTCKTLLEAGATHAPDAQGRTPLFFAIHGAASDEICQLLLDRGADPASPFDNLMGAAFRGRTRVCMMLLDRGATHAASDDDGNTPLHMAARQMHVSICALLLERGADVNARNKDGLTPLDLTLRNFDGIHTGPSDRRFHTQVLLLENGGAFQIDDKARTLDRIGRSIFHAVAAAGREDLCQAMLVRDESIIGLKDVCHHTPLHIAAGRGHLGICRILLDRGAPQEPDKNGWTPLTSATSYGHSEVSKLIRKYAPEPQTTTTKITCDYKQTSAGKYAWQISPIPPDLSEGGSIDVTLTNHTDNPVVPIVRIGDLVMLKNRICAVVSRPAHASKMLIELPKQHPTTLKYIYFPPDVRQYFAQAADYESGPGTITKDMLPDGACV